MITALILAASLSGQAASPVKPAPRNPEALLAELNAKNARRLARQTPAEKARIAAEAARRKAKQEAAYQAYLVREAVRKRELARLEKERQKYAEKMLPYELEKQRQMLERQSSMERNQLEAQRQMLQRQTDMERNAALGRVAGAMERSAGYVYPGQSPSVGQYAPPATVQPVNPLYAPLANP